MPTPHHDAATSGTPTDLEPVVITTNRRHLAILRTAMMRDLKELLDGACDDVHEVAEIATDWAPGEGVTHTRAYDARSHMEWIVEAVATLDDLGWASETGWDGYRA